jgi:hypothetical protein
MLVMSAFFLSTDHELFSAQPAHNYVNANVSFRTNRVWLQRYRPV